MEKSEEIAQTKEKAETVDTKLDRMLSQMLTLQGQVTIMQGQVNTMQTQMNKRFEEIDKRFDKIEEDHKEFKISLGKLLDKEFTKRDKAISKQAKLIKKLRNKPTLISCIKTGIRKLVSKTN